MILGVTGFFAAGKDSVAEILIQKGFRHVSLSDMIREEIRQRGEEITIPRLTQVGNEMRTQFGPQVLAERALRHLTDVPQAVVTSIRHSGEVQALRARPDFSMVFVDASIRTRYERSRGRARQGDPVTFEEFAAAEAQQMQNGDPNSQQLQACKEMADTLIVNDGTLETLEERINALLAQLEKR